VPAHFAPQRIGNRIGRIGHAGHHFGEFQRDTLGFGEIGRIAPGRHGEDMFLRRAGLEKFPRMHVHTRAATVDLAGAQVDEQALAKRDFGLRCGVQLLQGAHRVGQEHHGMGHTGLHTKSPWQEFPVAGRVPVTRALPQPSCR
jgi:hypothetical protein